MEQAVRRSRAEQQKLTHQRLLEAGRAVFARQGFLAATVDEIAAEAGYTRGAVYKHFGGKEGLWQAITDAVADAHLTRLCEALEGAETRSQLLSALVPEVGADDTRWSLASAEYLAAVSGRRDHAARIATVQRRFDERVTVALERCCSRLGIRPAMPAADLVAVLGTLGGALMLRSAIDPDTDAGALMSGLLDAMLPAGTEAGG